MSVVKFFVRLELDQIFLFLDGHYLEIFAQESRRVTIRLNTGLPEELSLPSMQK